MKQKGNEGRKEGSEESRKQRNMYGKFKKDRGEEKEGSINMMLLNITPVPAMIFKYRSIDIIVQATPFIKAP